MLDLSRTREELKVVYDQVGSPTSAADLAAFLLGVIHGGQLDKTGIYHYSDEGVCSWYDLACAVRDLGGGQARIRPCRSDEYPTKARRPQFSVLDKGLVKRTFGVEIPHWYDSLKVCMERL